MDPKETPTSRVEEIPVQYKKDNRNGNLKQQVRALFEEKDYQHSWEANHRQEIDNVDALLDSSKAVVVEGAVHSGKTTLAKIVTRKQQTSPENPQPIRVIFTTPAIQETFGAMTIIDRTGVEYTKIPSVDNLKQFQGEYIIVLDEISGRGPNPDMLAMWKKYIDQPNTKFLLLTHPGRAATAKWVSLFSQKDVSNYKIAPKQEITSKTG